MTEYHDSFQYVPLVRNLTSLLQNDDIFAEVHYSLFIMYKHEYNH